jgi:hypothetical protein
VQTVHRPFVLAPRPQIAAPLDGIAAEDTLLCRQLTHCSACGRKAVPGDLQCVVFVTACVVPALQCSDCRRRDPEMASLHAMLTMRYSNLKEG